MIAIDTQCQVLTPWGATLTPDQAEHIGKYLGKKLEFNMTDEQMAQVYREAGVKAIFVGPTHNIKERDIGLIREKNDRCAQFQKDHPDVVGGVWCGVNPQIGLGAALQEMERCIKDLKFAGYYAIQAAIGCPINDKSMYPFYDMCQDAEVPVKMNIGHTMVGAGTPGGGGLHLRGEDPMNFDDVCADFPHLTCIAAHNPWPWHLQMISILLHKPNAYCDNHGWPPATIPPELLREVNGRLNHKFIFGSDYPFYPYERIFNEWAEQIKKPEKLENVMINNAKRIFKHLDL